MQPTVHLIIVGFRFVVVHNLFLFNNLSISCRLPVVLHAAFELAGDKKSALQYLISIRTMPLQAPRLGDTV